MRAQLAPAGPIDIYARVSRKGDKDQRSTTGQVQVCRAALEDRGLPVGEILVDDGRSAWNPNVVREDWDKLMARLESGAAAGVVVFDLERFTRQPKEGERLIDAAERGLIVLDSDGEFDLTTASGKKGFRDALAAAAYYSDRLSDRVKRGKAAKARNGEVQRGGLNRPFGFEDDAITVRESEAAWIRWAAVHLLHGDPQPELVAHLNARGIKTAADGPWTQRGLRDMLIRERNRGNIAHNGAVVARLPGEPIIDTETFGRVAAKYAARRRGRPASPAYVCSGVAFCGRCGKRLAGRPRTSRRPYDDGDVRREYWCSPSAYGGCAAISVDQRDLDAAARALTVAILSDPRHASQIEAAAADRAEQARDLDALIAADEATALALADRLGRGEMDLARYDAATGPLDRRLAELRARRTALDASTDGGTASVPDGDWARRWDSADPAERRALLRMALRGRTLTVGPADSSDRANVTRRLTVGDRP